MPQFDAKTLDSDIDGAETLAAVLYATPAARAEARARGRQRMARAGSFAQAFTTVGKTELAARRVVKLA